VLQRRQGVFFFSAVLLTVVPVTGLMRRYFPEFPPPGFTDLCLVVVLALAYRYSWKLAAALAGVSLLLAACLWLPLDGIDRLELASYAACTAAVLYSSAWLHRRRA
jgi:hypothetical protein